MNRESGQALPMALILVTLAMLLAASVIPQLHTISRSQVSAEKNLMAYYAAEGTIDVVLADLAHGADASSEDYEIPNVTINGYTPDITISTPETGNAPDATKNYFDPNTSDPELEQIPPGNGYLLRLQALHPGQMEINWAYRPAGLTRIGVWQGETSAEPGQVLSWPDEEPIQTHTSTNSNNHLSFTVSDPGTYDVVLFNPLWQEQQGGGIDSLEEDTGNRGRGQRPNDEKTTILFADSTDEGHTWIYADSHKDYIIESTAGNVSVKAYTRQIPGIINPPASWSRETPSQIPRDISILSWSHR